MIRNPYSHHAPPGWNDIASAPRDGTLIEIQNNYGVAPTFGLFRWNKDFFSGWQSAKEPNSGVTDGIHLSWRPYAGAVEEYRDPTGGAQETRGYWLEACGYNPRDFPGSELPWHEEIEAERSAPRRAPARQGARRGFLARLFG